MLDNTDKRILEELSVNSRITMRELGKKVHLTGQATAERVIKMEETGVIRGYTIEVNQAELGYPVNAFITVMTQHSNHQPYIAFVKSESDYIINNYKISGEGCYLIEGKFPSNKLLDEFLQRLNEYGNYKLSIIINK